MYKHTVGHARRRQIFMLTSIVLLEKITVVYIINMQNVHHTRTLWRGVNMKFTSCPAWYSPKVHVLVLSANSSTSTTVPRGDILHGRCGHEAAAAGQLWWRVSQLVCPAGEFLNFKFRTHLQRVCPHSLVRGYNLHTTLILSTSDFQPPYLLHIYHELACLMQAACTARIHRSPEYT